MRRPPSPPVLAGVLALCVLGACGGGGDGEVARGTCGPDTAEALDPGSVQHVLPGGPEPSFLTDPPSSGPHLAGGQVSGVQRAPIDRLVQVAVLENGGVVVQHKDLDGAARRRLEALGDRDVVVAPNPGLPSPVVVTAWQRRLVCGGAGPEEVDAVERFVDEHRGGGPGH